MFVTSQLQTKRAPGREGGREEGTASPACNSYQCIIRQERTEGRKHVFREEEEEDLMRSAEERKEGTAYSRWGFCRCLELRINMLIMISETMTMTAKAHYCEEKEEESWQLGNGNYGRLPFRCQLSRMYSFKQGWNLKIDATNGQIFSTKRNRPKIDVPFVDLSKMCSRPRKTAGVNCQV